MLSMFSFDFGPLKHKLCKSFNGRSHMLSSPTICAALSSSSCLICSE